MPLTLNHDDQLVYSDQSNTISGNQELTGFSTLDPFSQTTNTVNFGNANRSGWAVSASVLGRTGDNVWALGSNGVSSYYGTGSISGGNFQTAIEFTSQGYVLTPKQPAFNAYLIQNPAANGYSTGGVYHASSTGIGVNPTNILILKHTIVNRGNHYSTSTGLFTAPVAGVYRFHHAHLPDNTQGGSVDNWAEFYINGGSTDAPEMYVQTSQLSQHGAQLSGSAVFQLQAGDTVGVYMYGGMHQRYATFNGYLIG